MGSDKYKASSQSPALTALRVLRILRIVKLVRHFRDFNQIFDGMRNTIKDISNICVLILIFIFIYALLSLELYAFRVTGDDGLPLK